MTGSDDDSSNNDVHHSHYGSDGSCDHDDSRSYDDDYDYGHDNDGHHPNLLPPRVCMFLDFLPTQVRQSPSVQIFGSAFLNRMFQLNLSFKKIFVRI